MADTVAHAIRAAAAALAEASITPRADAENLMAHALGVSRSDMLLRAMLDGWETPASFAALLARRMAHEPMAYILGNQEFCGRSFRVTPQVLIPRGDSEVLVERALAALPDARHVLDCGTGSGCLLITCLLELPAATGVGIDCSQAALHVAENNAQRLGLTRKQARFRLADWTMPGWADGLAGPFDLILANPPYVETDVPLEPSVRDHEPHTALFAGPDGLDHYRVLVPQLPGLLAAQGRAFVEIGAAQDRAVMALADSVGLAALLHHDLGGRARVVEMMQQR